MSFAGGAGRKSPFTERAKATKSHLSPRRSTSSSTSGVGSARSAQQSLFGKVSTFGGKDSQFGDSSAKGMPRSNFLLDVRSVAVSVLVFFAKKCIPLLSLRWRYNVSMYQFMSHASRRYSFTSLLFFCLLLSINSTLVPALIHMSGVVQ